MIINNLIVSSVSKSPQKWHKMTQNETEWDKLRQNETLLQDISVLKKLILNNLSISLLIEIFSPRLTNPESTANKFSMCIIIKIIKIILDKK